MNIAELDFDGDKYAENLPQVPDEQAPQWVL
jgi:hypothetical protein